MFRAWFLIPGLVLLTSAIAIRTHQTDEESLKTALDAVTRKQRSLDFSGRDYYNDLQNFKYRPNDGEDEDTFQRPQDPDLEDNNEDLEFLPLENGQLENIGGGYQNYNDKRLERALLDYLESSSGQRETVPSSFRERERSGSHKRALMAGDRASAMSGNEPDRDLSALLYKELQKGPSYRNMAELDNRDYPMLDTLQPYYDRYLEQSKLNPSKFYDPMSSDSMSWGEIFGKPQQESARTRGNKKLLLENASGGDGDSEEAGTNDEYGNGDRDWTLMLPTERRNVNGRYPLGREYGARSKRCHSTKRSANPPIHHEKEASGVVTDPKVAKDLGPLFGSQKPGAQHSKKNRTSDDETAEMKDDSDDRENDHDHSGSDHDHSGHDRSHDHDHGNDHDHSGHDHSHDHDHSNDHDHDRSTVAPSQTGLESAPSSLLSSSPASLVNTPKSPGQKELNSNGRGNNGAVVSKLLNKRANNVELAKKRIVWSDHFGIDRRRKKAALLARPGTQDRDDEWMLQRYYKTMAENLKSTTANDEENEDDEADDDDADKDNADKRNKLDQMDARLKNVKNLIVVDALKYGNEGNSQEVKDVVMARLAAAYSLEKMRRALNEFRSNIAAQRDLMRAAHANNNDTHHYRDTNAEKKKENDNEKRAGHGIYDESRYQAGRNYEGFDEGRGCPALDAIVDRCPRLDGKLRAVQELCIMHQICLACDDELGDCASMFTFRAEKICQDIAQDPRHCVHMVSYSARQPSSMAVSACHHADSCLRRSDRYRQRGVYYQNGWPPHAAALDPLQLAER